MRRLACLSACFAAGLPALAAAPALAEIEVAFTEGSPTDVFSIRHDGDCALGPFTLEIDLSASAGGLYFDTTAGGAGLQTYQPFELIAGAERVTAISPVGDGDARVRLSFSRFEPGERVAFTIDVDDRMTAGPLGQTLIDGSEIAGGRVSIGAAQGLFDAGAIARLPTPDCAAVS